MLYNLSMPVAPQICPGCRSSFTPYNNRKNAVFCSYKCGLLHRNRIAKQVRLDTIAALEMQCVECRLAFKPANTVHQKFCSPKCKAAFNTRKRNTLIAYTRKQCGVCGEDFTTSRSHVKYCSRRCRVIGHSTRAKVRNKINPQLRSDYMKEYRKRNNLAVRKHRLKNWYGISLEQYEQLLLDCGNRCMICTREFTSSSHVHVDHIHGEENSEKAIRGLLCYKCNPALGLFEDNQDHLQAAIAYLKRSR